MPIKKYWSWVARHRLLVSVFSGFTVAVLLPPHYPWLTRTLCVWDTCLIGFLGLTLLLMIQVTPEEMRHYARQLGIGRTAILGLILTSACTSFLALIFLLHHTKNLPPDFLALHLGLSVLTIIGSWSLVHTIFAIHYASGYYKKSSNPSHDNTELRKGLDFPGDRTLEYIDFLYFSFGVGIACQVADVQTTSRSMRSLVLLHSALSFFFNTAILAMSVNIIAGLG